MSSYSQTGTATVYGVDGALTYSAIPTEAAYQFQSAEFNHGSNVQELKDSSGRVINVGSVDDIYDLVIDMAPVAKTTQSEANAQSALVIPATHTKVTVSSMANSQMDGNYLYLGGGRIRQTNEGHAIMTLPLKRWATDVTTTVS